MSAKNVGGRNERTNLAVVEHICDLLDDMVPTITGPRRQMISFVQDRPGHDRRYAIDASKLERTLGWRARESFDSGIEKTVRWYIDNEAWWRAILDRGYTANRVGLGAAGRGSRPSSARQSSSASITKPTPAFGKHVPAH